MWNIPARGLPTRLPKPCITNAKLIPRPKYLDSTIFFRDKLYPRFAPPAKAQNSCIKIPWKKMLYKWSSLRLWCYNVQGMQWIQEETLQKYSFNKSCVYVTVDVNLSHCFISVDLIFHCSWLFVLFSYIGILFYWFRYIHSDCKCLCCSIWYVFLALFYSGSFLGTSVPG